MSSWRDRVRRHLGVLYPDADLDELTGEVIAAVGVPDDAASGEVFFDERDTVLITYGDSIVDDELTPLQALQLFVAEELRGAIDIVHVLPFAPWSSDRGFSVIDYHGVDPALGSWDDIDALTDTVEVMMDLVVNHASSESAWFRQYLAGVAAYDDFFVRVEGDPDLSAVVRPRSLPLLHAFEGVRGVEQIWTTFSADQVDLDYANPRVLIAMLEVIDRYCSHGARLLRLDAIGYLWKEIGTSCLHLHQTHEVVKLLRTLLEARSPKTAIITETNVPHADNVSYFGDGDEAHLVYNFSLAPLVVHAACNDDPTPLRRWLAELAAPPPGCAYLNFLASHDGIGLRPAEGLLSDAQVADLVARAEAVGGTHGTYDAPDGPRPYELNVSLVDLFGGDHHLVDRFVCAHAIMLAVAGIPALYVNSLLATANDRDRMDETGVRREINRPSVSLGAARSLHGERRAIFERLRELLEARRQVPVFHPAAPMTVLDLHPSVVAIERRAGEQRLVALHNVSRHGAVVELDGSWRDHLSGADADGPVALDAYEVRWLTFVS